MKNGRSLHELALELDRQRTAKRDLVVPSALMQLSTDETGNSTVSIDDNGSWSHYGITELARRQLAEKLHIPFPYFERMRTEQPALLDRNVNTWLHAGHDARLIRTMDRRVRAVLSDRYRRLDNWDLAEQVLPILQRLPGARFESVELTDTRLYLKVVTPKLEYEMAPGDAVQAGVVVSNSEVGWGRLTVQPLLYRLICSNGLIAADHSLRKTHLGRLLESSESSVLTYQEDTLRADDKALFLKVRDVVEAAVSETTFQLIAQKMQATMGIRLSGNPARSVQVLGKQHGLDDEEQGGVLRYLIAGGDLSAYGVVNAVTHFSQEMSDYDRATDLEALGGKLIELPLRDWKEIVEAS